MKRTLKQFMQKFGIGAASFGLAISVLFPTAALANSSLDSSTNLLSERSSLSVTPKNYAGVTTSAAPVTVIVELSNKPVNVYENETKSSSFRSSVSQRSRVLSEHKTFSASAKQIGVTIGFEYSDIFNGYSVTLPGNQVDKLLKLPGVVAIYPNEEVHALSSNVDTTVAPVTRSYSDSGELIGAYKLHEEGYTGKGVKVAVVDTGIDMNHPLLKDNYVAEGSYDVVDRDPIPLETQPDENFLPRDGNPYETSHGTHVAGTVLDIAPDAEIYAYRVLGPYGSGSSADVIAGVEKAVQQKVDIINLSLGSGINQSYTAHSIAIDNAIKSGVNVVVAAGNDGPGEGTLGAPAGSQLAITVGASTTKVNTPFFNVGDAKKIVGIIAAFSPELTESISGTKIVYAGLGSSADYVNLDAKDKVVLVDRGTYSFGEKSLNAKAAGAKLLLIANNTAGELSSITLGGPGSYVPTYGINQASGKAIQAQIKAAKDTLSYSLEEEKNQLADFSSTGPGMPDYLLKPDVVAPGVSINSTLPLFDSTDGTYDTAFGAMNGTSMATPHVAGAVALLLGNNPDLEPNEIKALLMNNADPIYARNGSPYSLYQQGAGLINLVKSTKAASIAKVGEIFNSGVPGSKEIPYYTGSLSFGIQPKGTSVTKAVYLDGFGIAQGEQYKTSIEWLTDAPKDINYIIPEAITSGEGQYASVKFNVSKNAKDGAYEGILNLTSDIETLRLPLNIVVGEAFKSSPVDQLSLDDPQLSPNGDGIFDSTYFGFSVNQELKGVKFVASPYEEPTTVLGVVYSTDETLYRGLVEVENWDGSITNPDTSETTPLPDGHYWLTPVLSNGQLDENQSILFTIDTEKPVVSGISLEEYDRETDADPREAQIYGYIDSDLMADYISASKPISSWFSAYAEGVDEAGNPAVYEGSIFSSGAFAIDVPIHEGLNQFRVYVADKLGNGLEEDNYAQRLLYNTNGGYTVIPTAAKTVEIGQPVTVDLGFSVTDEVYGVYGTSFGVVYKDTLTPPVVRPSVQLATYQEEHFAGVPLTEDTHTYDLGDGYKLTQYSAHLSGGAYTGSGSLAELTFTPTEVGTYSFELYDVQIWNDALTSTIPAGLSTVSVTVYKPETPVTPVTPGPYVPTTSVPTGITLKSGSLVETADAAGGKPTAVYTISDAALTAALSKAVDNVAVLDITDVTFAKYGQVSFTLTPAQAEQLKKSEKALSLSGTGFNVLIPVATIPDFISSTGLTLTISLKDATTTATLAGNAAAINIGSSILTIKNGWTTGKPVILQLTLAADALKDVHKTGIYKETTDAKWSYLQAGTIVKEGILQFTVTADGSYSAASRNTSFIDIGSHWAKNDIEALAAHGIIAGKGTDGSFKPSDTLVQAELLTLFDRLLGKGDTWSTRIKESGSRDVLTREEAALILAEALGADLTVAKIDLTFKDADQISSEARNAVAYAVTKGYLKGEGANIFNPQGTLTRAQAATILIRVLEDLRSK